MLSFPQGFFENEVRDDFLVDSTMKTVWAAGLEVLAVIADVCAKYQLPWYADWGTLLGAVRHNGYVPWDDDIDICLLRPDYNRLMEVLQQELPKGWIVYNAACGHRQEQFWTCVMNSDSVSIEQERLRAFHGCPFIVGVDIFPIDYLPRDPAAADAEKTLFTLIWKTVRLAKTENPSKKDKKDLELALKGIEDFCNVKFDREKDLVTQLWKLANEVVGSYGEADADQVVEYLNYVKWSIKMDKHWFDDVDYLPFESVELPVPYAYHQVLTAKYGDYSQKYRNTAAHDYPYYNKQLEQMRKKIQEMEERVANQAKQNNSEEK